MSSDLERFKDAPHPRFYNWAYNRVSRHLERRGGLNITGSRNLVADGRVVYTANHEHLLDFLVVGITVGRGMRVPGKKELKSWKYGFLPGYLLQALGAELFDREGSARKPLEKSLEMLESEAAVHSFIEETRKRSFADFTPRDGVAWLAIKATAEKPCPIVPIGLSTAKQRKGLPIQVVIGEPFMVASGMANLPPPQIKALYKELTPQIGSRVVALRDQSMELHEKRAGTPGKIVWND